MISSLHLRQLARLRVADSDLRPSVGRRGQGRWRFSPWGVRLLARDLANWRFLGAVRLSEAAAFCGIGQRCGGFSFRLRAPGKDIPWTDSPMDVSILPFPLA